MDYIYLEDLKDTLPAIMNDWIDVDDESWEWIFNAIEQNCHVGKKSKKKKKKYNKKEWIKRNRVDIDVLIQKFQDLNKEVEEMHRDFIDTKNNVTQLGLSMKDMGAEIKHIREDSKAAKSMAETAKRRTEVDYSKYSGKSDGNISYCNPEDKDCKTCKYYHNCYGISDDPCIKCDAYQYWEKKEEQNKSCINCKYHSDKNSIYNCTCPNGACGSDNKNWEAKDE